MINGASAFIANFSLRKLVNDKLRLPVTSPAGSRSGGGRFFGSGQTICHRSESFTCPIYASEYVSFDEKGFVTSLRAEIEKEIISREAAIGRQGNIEGDFNSSEFYFEYTQGEIKGRIVISGKMIKGGYYLSVEIEEIVKGLELPSVTTEFTGVGPGLMCGVSGSVELPSEPNAFKWAKPEGDYHIVLFKPDDPLAQDYKFRRIGFELLQGSRNRIPTSVTGKASDSFKYVEILSLYDALYFLNEAALQMYREGGFELETLKKISSDEIPQRCNRILGGPYFPR